MSASRADPSPLRSGETNLTGRVRALYEGAGVPVREIARLAGVTERTIYKYAARQNWTPRYRWRADGARPAGVAREVRRGHGSGWQAPSGFAPAKGAGGRFIRRDEAGKPVAAGLKATDPAGHAFAAAACDAAGQLAAQAEAKARQDRRNDDRIRAWQAVNRALDRLADFREERRTKPHRRRPAHDDAIERAHVLTVEAALDWQEALLTDET